MQHVFILLVAVPEANWQNDYSKINVKTKLFVNMYCIYCASCLYHTSNSLLFTSFTSTFNNSGLKFWFPDNREKKNTWGKSMSPFKKQGRAALSTLTTEQLIRRFVTTHIVQTAQKGVCMFSPELSVYIRSAASSFSSSSWHTGGTNLRSDLIKEKGSQLSTALQYEASQPTIVINERKGLRNWMVEDDKGHKARAHNWGKGPN